MSKQSAIQFLQRLATEPELGRQPGQSQGWLEANQVVAMGAALGYSFTPEELISLVGSYPQELSEEELANVSGGIGSTEVGNNSELIVAWPPVYFPPIPVVIPTL